MFSQLCQIEQSTTYLGGFSQLKQLLTFAFVAGNSVFRASLKRRSSAVSKMKLTSTGQTLEYRISTWYNRSMPTCLNVSQ